jgi:polysaccharide pyruvyl transferase WcaK-like protein
LTKYTRPLVLGIDQDLPTADKPLDERLAWYGDNTGNFLFSEALFQVVDNSTRATYHYRKKHIDEADVVVIAAANWVNAYSDFGQFAARLKTYGKPVVLVGIGIQTAEGEKPQVTPGTRSLLDLAAETSAMISVRGHRTAEVLQGWGYSNVMATGCPSLLLAGGRFTTHHDTPRPTAANTVLMGTRHHFRLASADQQEIYRFAYRNGVDMIMQSELADMYFIADVPRDTATAVKANTALAASYGDVGVDNIRKYLRRHGRVFFHARDWRSYLQGKEYVIGTRIHGTIAAILSGGRGILLSHDPRTAELAEIMGIPTARLGAVDKLGFDRLAELVDATDFDLTRRTFPAYRDRFEHFFALNGLTLRPPVVRFGE